MEPSARVSDDVVDLRHYVDVLKRRKGVVAAAVVIVTLVAVVLSLLQTPQYRSTAEVLLQENDAEQRLGLSDQANVRVDQNRVDTEIGVIESNLVENAVTEALGREPDISVSAQGETDIVGISATSTDPEEAANEANVYANTYVEWRRQRTIDDLLAAQQTVQAEIDSLEAQIDELEAPIVDLEGALFASQDPDERAQLQADIEEAESDIEPQVNAIQSSLALYQAELSSLQVSQRITRTGGVQIISDAVPADDPFAPQPLRNGVLGLVVGLIIGVGIAFLLETLDDRVRSKEQLERVTGWPTLGLIPIIGRAKGGQHDLVTVEDPTSASAEAYRALRTALQFVALERPLEIIQVTSAHSGEGKTTTAANLAVMMAKAGKRVILLDADLRKPRVHQEFGLSNHAGFTTMLLDSTPRADTFQRTSIERLVIAPSGPPPPNPSELLSLQTTRTVIERLRGECDVLIIDSPPVLPVTDPLVISAYVDGVLVVTDAKSARGKDLTRTRELLTQANANVIGINVNRVPSEGTYAYGYGYGYGDDYIGVDPEPVEPPQEEPEEPATSGRSRIFRR